MKTAGLTKSELDVFSWRRTLAEGLGYLPGLADEIALGTVDLREVERLLERGCPHELALEIAR